MRREKTLDWLIGGGSIVGIAAVFAFLGYVEFNRMSLCRNETVTSIGYFDLSSKPDEGVFRTEDGKTITVRGKMVRPFGTKTTMMVCSD